MKKFFTLILLLTIVAQQIYAVPAYPYPVKYQLPDESTLTITLKGDENVHWATSEDGYTLLLNKDGFYEYATLDENNNLILSGIQAKDMSNRNSDDFTFLSGIERDLRYSDEQINYLLQLYEFRNTMSKFMEERGDLPSSRITGVVRFPLILVGFQGKPFTLQKSQFEALMNQPNYTTGGITGSVYDYFYASSYGQFDFQVDVFGPYTMSNAISYYDDGCGGDPRKMAREAATAASNDNCDFSLYDYNNDGVVDGMHIIFAGYDQAGGAPACQSIWSHSWSIDGTALMLNGKRVLKYSCSPEFRNTYGTNITYMGVIAHELSHVLGLPDTYDTDYGNSGGQSVDLDAWDLMAGGSWNDNGRTPPFHSAYCRNYLGWTTLQVLSSPATITIPNPQTQGMTYRINTTTNNEFFLLENRQKVGWDAYIPNSGMLIYHVDKNYSGWNSNCINCNPSHRGYYVKQAGCSNVNSNCSNRNTDPYPYGSNNSFTDTSIPNSKSWAGANTEKPITEITHNTANRTITFKFMDGITLQQYTVSLSASPANSGTLEGAGTYYENDEVSVTAKANAGYTFYNWTKNGLQVSSNPTYVFNITGNTDLVANFRSSNANLSNITVVSGTLTPTFSPYTTSYTVNVANSVSTISIIGTAEDANATITGNVVNAPLNIGSNSFTITVTAQDNTKKNYTVKVIRSNIPQFTITASVDGNIGGTVKPEGVIVVNQGENVTFEIVPDDKYIIDSLFLDNVSIGVVDTLTLENIVANHTIVVKFLYYNSIKSFDIQKIEIYPNPANNYVTIKSDALINTLVLYNYQGEKILEIKNLNEKLYKIDMNRLVPGVYYLRVNNMGKKIIKVD